MPHFTAYVGSFSNLESVDRNHIAESEFLQSCLSQGLASNFQVWGDLFRGSVVVGASFLSSPVSRALAPFSSREVGGCPGPCNLPGSVAWQAWIAADFPARLREMRHGQRGRQ